MLLKYDFFVLFWYAKLIQECYGIIGTCLNFVFVLAVGGNWFRMWQCKSILLWDFFFKGQTMPIMWKAALTAFVNKSSFRKVCLYVKNGQSHFNHTYLEVCPIVRMYLGSKPYPSKYTPTACVKSFPHFLCQAALAPQFKTGSHAMARFLAIEQTFIGYESLFPLSTNLDFGGSRTTSLKGHLSFISAAYQKMQRT